MIDSIAPQLNSSDYLTIIWDREPYDVKINSECNVIKIHNPEPLGFWGHGSRNRWIPELPGDYIMNADDDNIYSSDAMEKIRRHAKEEKLYIFKIFKHLNGAGYIIPHDPVVRVGNIDTACGVYPNVKDMPTWEHEYGGDGMFYEKLSKVLPYEFVNEIIYTLR